MAEQTGAALTRFGFWKEAFWRPAGTLVGIPYAIWGALAFLRDEVIQPQNAQLWKPVYWLAKLPWWVWVTASLAIALIVLFEGAFRAIRRIQTEREGQISVAEKTIAELRDGTRPRVTLFLRYDQKTRWQEFRIRNDGGGVAFNVTCSDVELTGRALTFVPIDSLGVGGECLLPLLDRETRRRQWNIDSAVFASFSEQDVNRVFADGTQKHRYRVTVSYTDVTGTRYAAAWDWVFELYKNSSGQAQADYSRLEFLPSAG